MHAEQSDAGAAAAAAAAVVAGALGRRWGSAAGQSNATSQTTLSPNHPCRSQEDGSNPLGAQPRAEELHRAGDEGGEAGGGAAGGRAGRMGGRAGGDRGALAGHLPPAEAAVFTASVAQNTTVHHPPHNTPPPPQTAPHTAHRCSTKTPSSWKSSPTCARRWMRTRRPRRPRWVGGVWGVVCVSECVCVGGGAMGSRGARKERCRATPRRAGTPAAAPSSPSSASAWAPSGLLLTNVTQVTVNIRRSVG